MADRTCSLLEFIAFCFEKNELWAGGSLRNCPYTTPEFAREQYERLLREARQYFAPAVPTEIPFGVYWPNHLAIVHMGCAVMVRVAATKGGPAWKWGECDPDWTHVNESGELSVLFGALKQISG